MASCIIKSASSSSDSEASDNHYPDLPDGSTEIHTEPFPSSPIGATDQFMAEDSKPSRETVLFHQISIIAGSYAFLDLPENFDAERRAALVVFIESHRMAIKMTPPFASNKDFTEMQLKKASCISCAIRVLLSGFRPQLIYESCFMDQVKKLLSVDDLDSSLLYIDPDLLEYKISKVIYSKNHEKLVEFLESCPIGTLPQVFHTLGCFFYHFAISHEDIESLQYLIDILGIKSKRLFRTIVYRTENQEVKDFFLRQIKLLSTQ